MFNLEAKCNFLKNRDWQVINQPGNTSVYMFFVLTVVFNTFVTGMF